VPSGQTVMAEEHDRLGAVPNPDLEVVAPVVPSMPQGGDACSLPEEVSDLIRARVATGLVERGRLGQHEALQGGEHGGPIGPLHQGAVHAKTGGSSTTLTIRTTGGRKP